MHDCSDELPVSKTSLTTISTSAANRRPLCLKRSLALKPLRV
jgi:hypothetical protein